MPTKHAEHRRREIMTDIAKIGFCLPGSLVKRTTRCGNPSCACHTDPDRIQKIIDAYDNTVLEELGTEKARYPIETCQTLVQS